LAIFRYTLVNEIVEYVCVTTISIRELQGEGLMSPYSGQQVETTGVVTGVVRRGFFIQMPNTDWDGRGSNGIYGYSPNWNATRGAELVVKGECVDYTKHDTAKPVTQLQFESATFKQTDGPAIEPIVLTRDFLPDDDQELATLLNSLEGMLLAIEPGQTFIAPSNRYGDYVVALDAPTQDTSGIRTCHGGFVPGHDGEQRWLPGFRATNYNFAPRLNLGSKLTSRVVGPLNYRADSYQLSVNDKFEIEENFIPLVKSSLTPSEGSVTVMTLNCFNLDPKVESAAKVMNPRQDVDDDWGEGRFHTLGQAVVLYANTPDIVALQEIQDSDGAELSDVVEASDTYALLIGTIHELSGVEYSSGQRLSIINIHLASKRHQESIFAPLNPGVDAKLGVRVAQAESIKDAAEKAHAQGYDYYVTGDFNDTEHSSTLATLTSASGSNLVMSLPEVERYDYNHRGKLQVLMHGIVPQAMQDEGRAEYEIIHGNELLGVTPSEESDKPSDHAYVIAKIKL